MKTCKTCGGDLNRGSTAGVGGNTHCVICKVARALANFHWTKKGK